MQRSARPAVPKQKPALPARQSQLAPAHLRAGRLGVLALLALPPQPQPAPKVGPEHLALLKLGVHVLQGLRMGRRRRVMTSW